MHLVSLSKRQVLLLGSWRWVERMLISLIAKQGVGREINSWAIIVTAVLNVQPGVSELQLNFPHEYWAPVAYWPILENINTCTPAIFANAPILKWVSTVGFALVYFGNLLEIFCLVKFSNSYSYVIITRYVFLTKKWSFTYLI